MGASKSYKKLEIENSEGITVRRDKKGKLRRGSILNPEGRTLGSLSLINILKKKLIKISEKDKKYIYADLVIQKLIDKALEGDISALREIFNRIEGMPKTNLDITSGGGKIVPDEIIKAKALEAINEYLRDNK